MLIEKFFELAPNPNQVEVLAVLSKLLTQYSAPHRHYHNLIHIECGLHTYFNFYSKIDVTDFFAWAYHDVVYHPLDSDNENKSAGYFLKDSVALGFNIAQKEQWEVADVISNKILETVHASKSHSFVNDMDLSTLGMDKSQYEHYADLIRQEYVPPLSEEAFTLGRIQVLERLLSDEHSPIFWDREFKDKFEDQARINMSVEVAQLQLKKAAISEKV
jgi:predicted metal-dependent HD superfamily phosphohydrolase